VIGLGTLWLAAPAGHGQVTDPLAIIREIRDEVAERIDDPARPPRLVPEADHPATALLAAPRTSSAQEEKVKQQRSALQEQQEQLQKALLGGNATYFENIAKPELNALNAAGCFSYIHEVCLEHQDNLLPCFRALLGGLKNEKAIGVICRELLYLDPEPLLVNPGGQEQIDALRKRLNELIARGSNRVDPRTLAELQARYSVARAPRRATREEDESATPEALLQKRRLIPVSGIGAARATAYTMTNLFFRHQGRLYFAWQDQPVINCLGVLSPEMSRPAVVCVLGVPTDDHGNAAIAKDTQGRIHAVVGAHHGPLWHRVADDADKPYHWRTVGEVGKKATHPCLVCDRTGTLHLVYRSSAENPWLLCYQRFGSDGAWTPAVPLVRAVKRWYVTWTNSLAVGPDNALHLVFAVSKFIDKVNPYFGAAHIYSPDGGRSWRQYGGQPLTLPVDAAAVATIEDPAEAAGRTMPAEQWQKLPDSDHAKLAVTLQMLLSNLVVDGAGRPWVVVHNTLEKAADLYGAENGRWRRKAELLPTVQHIMPGYSISEQSALSRHGCGYLEAVLMIVPLRGRQPRSFVGWQSSDLQLLRILLDEQGQVLGARLVSAVDPQKATWLPNLEKWDWNHPFDHPALLFSSGPCGGSARESGKRTKNAKQDLFMDVWLDLPQP
jgi:hypothetical protein